MNQNINEGKAIEFLTVSNRLLSQNVIEDVLVKNLNAYLPQIFLENPWWVRDHIEGSETYVRFSTYSGSDFGFVDSLVGKTVIEYEKDLSSDQLFRHGLDQVKDYCAALLNKDVSQGDIIGILSDTVKWYAYKIDEIKPVTNGFMHGRDSITLKEIFHLDLTDPSSINAQKFIDFFMKYIGRENSRELTALSLAADLGLESPFCDSHRQKISNIIHDAFNENEHYASLIKKVWCNFVSYIGDSKSQAEFDIDNYINEYYIITLAKCLCANILEKQALLVTNDEEAIEIMDGRYFQSRGFDNLVEYDYFGWVNNTPYAEDLCSVIFYIQNDLRAYDFEKVTISDLFGPLIAQLARRDQRLLLGQEFTPQWLAEEIAGNTISMLPSSEKPRFIDMCCGSGVFIVETLKHVVKKYDLNTHTLENYKLFHQSITGFDIDPLAVFLSRVNWILVFNTYIKYAPEGNVSIPIYHADSFCLLTPISQNLDSDSNNISYLQISIDNEKISIPKYLLTPEYQPIFDELIKRCYSVAMNIAQDPSCVYTPLEIKQLVNSAIGELRVSSSILDDIVSFSTELIEALSQCQRNGRNGIWAFILENNYRPSLLKGYFNGIISNPPWMALSKLSENPYKSELINRAKHYLITPPGGAHPHVELASLFLLQSVKHYLSLASVFGCIMPDSILKGYNHEPFRRQQYTKAQPPVNLNVTEIWSIDKTTFKNKAIVLFGNNNPEITSFTRVPGNFISFNSNPPEKSMSPLQYQLIQQGKRTAWSDNPQATSLEAVLDKIPFLQGADIMPRILIFFECKKQVNGLWSLNSISNESSQKYLIKGAKLHQNFKFTAENISDKYLFNCLMSHHLTPYHISKSALALLPLQWNSDGDGGYKAISENQLNISGTSNKLAFQKILSKSNYSYSEYFKKLNYRNKLSNQVFPEDGWLVLVGASGSYTCAGYLNLSTIDSKKLIIDQTLYWYIAASEFEALYIVGLLNSHALDLLISEFQPEGLQGRRHIHTLPYSITPPYDATNELHQQVVNNTKVLIFEMDEYAQNNSSIIEYFQPESGILLSNRRSKVRNILANLSSYEKYEEACREVYNVRLIK